MHAPMRGPAAHAQPLPPPGAELAAPCAAHACAHATPPLAHRQAPRRCFCHASLQRPCAQGQWQWQRQRQGRGQLTWGLACGAPSAACRPSYSRTPAEAAAVAGSSSFGAHAAASDISASRPRPRPLPPPSAAGAGAGAPTTAAAASAAAAAAAVWPGRASQPQPGSPGPPSGAPPRRRPRVVVYDLSSRLVDYEQVRCYSCF